MSREEFFAKLTAFDEEHAKKALWNLYWRGSAAMRGRIEVELDGDRRDPQAQQAKQQSADPQLVLDEIRGFAALARSGAYIAGDRRVSSRERTRWRFTFQRLAGDAQAAVQAGGDFPAAAAAVERLIDLACEMRGYDYFRSEDPIEAARFVVSDAVALLWAKMRDTYGFAGFAERAAPQLIRWESPYGWTRSGWGRISEKERSLAAVVAAMLPAIDMWIGFADSYLDALDQVAGGDRGEANPSRRPGRDRQERARDLAEWHLLLLDRLTDTDGEDRLDRLAHHRALGGPELTFFQARLAYQRGDVGTAHELAHECLQALPGHADFLDFATSIGSPLPPRAQRALNERQMRIESAD
jgi:hypothetical protein